MKRFSLVDLAETIKNNRTEKGIAQERLCEETGVNRLFLQHLEAQNFRMRNEQEQII